MNVKELVSLEGKVAIVTGGRGTVKGKTEAIVKAGGKVAKRPSEVGALLKALLG